MQSYDYCLSGLRLLPCSPETTAFPARNYCLSDREGNRLFSNYCCPLKSVCRGEELFASSGRFQAPNKEGRFQMPM